MFKKGKIHKNRGGGGGGGGRKESEGPTHGSLGISEEVPMSGVAQKGVEQRRFMFY